MTEPTPSLSHVFMQVVVSVIDALDVALRQGGVVVLALLIMAWSWLKGRRRS